MTRQRILRFILSINSHLRIESVDSLFFERYTCERFRPGAQP